MRPMLRTFAIRSAVLTLLLAAIACKAGAVAEKLRPTDPSAAEALGQGACKDVAAGAEPLVVDWKPEARADLEVAMRDGVAVVAYSCDSLKLLTECRIEGSYGFIGMTRKEHVVRLLSADEVRANLPFSQGSIGGELTRGASLDIAMILVGKKRTTWEEPTTGDLVGNGCAGATHYVRGATVGAFVVEMGTAAKARVAAEIFGIGASAGSDSTKSSRTEDGDPGSCEKADPDAPTPPQQCGAPIRLVLAPIAQPKAAKDDAAAAAAAAPVAQRDHACPAGLVFAEGKCTAAANAKAYQCRHDDASECTTQCERGHAGSCGSLGLMHAMGVGAKRDGARAATLLRKGCDGGDANSCVNLGLMTERGDGVAQDAAAAAKLFEQGCDAGIALGCERLGQAVLARDPKRAGALLRQACDGGEDTGCAAAASLLAKSKNGDDRRLALQLHERACAGTVGQSCVEVGRLHEQDTGGAHGILAEQFYRRACVRGVGEGCFDLGRLELPRDPDGAKRSFDAACLRLSQLACAALVVGWGEKRPIVPNVNDKQKLQRGCTAGDARDCARVGLFDAAIGSPLGKANLERACRDRDAFACAIAKRLK
jgi:TPR repeat protein